MSASREASGYDLETRKRIWSASGLGQNTIPAPVAADGLAFVMIGFREPNLMAIRLGRRAIWPAPTPSSWSNAPRTMSSAT